MLHQQWGQDTDLMFQFAMQRVGLFFVLFCIIQADCQDESLSFMYTVKQPGGGRTAPYWLEAAQLEAGSNCPVKHNNLSHHRCRLITNICHYLCYASMLQRRWSTLFTWCYEHGHGIGRSLATQTSRSPPGLADRVKRKGRDNTFSTSLAAGFFLLDVLSAKAN